ncbi:HD domain-containing protein [Bacillus sp. CGMCC 1.16541]|uniref:HD domain-containing protein n=1 Tax=Bacillus sp. CGMCC 1.16541 TaxID=2185143 RepID=UPI000D725F56|nr:HD domain-containing protein [Bacillus sp. CGMCC 1.16541]
MEEVINRTKGWVREKLKHDTTGHDWAHIRRVYNHAIYLASKEGGQLPVIQLAALLHDIVDDKLVKDVDAAYIELTDWLHSQLLPESMIIHILDIIKNMSFKGGSGSFMQTIEGKIVQDADRLDAIGAIGIARTFMYAGAVGHAMYKENVSVRETMTEEEYRNGSSTAIQHFYEKLLKLTELMNTQTAKKLAQERHDYMEQFLTQFMKEWKNDYENVDG